MTVKVLRAIMVAVFAVCSAGVEAQPLDKVTMGITGTSSDVASFIARKKGYFRAEGLEVDQSTTRMGVNSIAALTAGEYDASAGAATAPFCAKLVGLLVLWPWMASMALAIGSGAAVQPSRQPVMLHAFAKPCTMIVCSKCAGLKLATLLATAPS